MLQSGLALQLFGKVLSYLHVKLQAVPFKANIRRLGNRHCLLGVSKELSLQVVAQVGHQHFTEKLAFETYRLAVLQVFCLFEHLFDC